MANYKMTNSESEEQQTLFQWAEYMIHAYPQLALMYHVPNGGARSAGTAGRLKAEGVKSGVPDICLPAPSGVYHGMYIELKVKPNRPTLEQKWWLEQLSNAGYFTCVCYGWEEASLTIEKYLSLNDGERYE